MGKWSTIISLIYSKDELSFKVMRMWAQSKISSCCICDWCVVFVIGVLYLWLVWINKNGRQGESKIINTNGGKFYRPSSSYKNLLDRVTFWIVYIAWRVGYKIVTHNATFLGVGRRNSFFCACVAKTVLIFLLSLLLCILLWCWCLKIAKWTDPINVNIRFQTLHISLSFLSCFATQSYMQIHM